MPTDTNAQSIAARWRQLKSERAPFEATWQEVADYMRPLRAEMLGPRPAGERRGARIFDSTPLHAADNFASGIYGLMTSPANKWFALKTDDPELDRFDAVRDWLDVVEDRLLASFAPPVGRFYAVAPSLYADLACFGTAVFFSEEIPGERRIADAVRPLSEICIAENAWGDVDTVYRRFSLSARNAFEMFGERLSDKVRRQADKAPDSRVFFIHAVAPNADYEPGAMAERGKPFLSLYLEEEGETEVARGGYYEMPYQCPRWAQGSGEAWGRGLGELALADVKMLNRMDETAIRAAQKIADPPLAAPDEGVIRVARTFPGGITYGAINEQGVQLLRPLYTGGDVGAALKMQDERRQAVREAFHFSLMQMVGAPNMTASEWLGRQEEKLRLMGPNLGRIQSEFLSPLIRRRYGILSRAGQLPPPPPDVAGRTLEVEYVSPLARAQMAGEANAIVRLYQSLLPIASADPGVLDNIDHDEAVRALMRGWAVPAKVARGADDVEAMRETRQQMQAAQAGLMAGAQGAGILQTLTDAAKNQRAG